LLTDEQELLWRMYAENAAHARHHEVLRSNVSGYVLIVASALVGIVTLDKSLGGWVDIMAEGFIICAGLFGAAFVMKHYERYRLHMARAQEYRAAIDRLLAAPILQQCKERGDAAHASHWHFIRKLRVAYWWASLNLVVAFLGVALLAITLAAPQETPPPGPRPNAAATS
jgi:hypothetical protein